MLWLTITDALARGFQVKGSPVPQYLEFPADVKQLSGQIPVEAQFEQQGFCPSPANQWYGFIGTRPVVLEQEEHGLETGRVFVHTSYLPQQDELGDWSVLVELSELPRAIQIGRPSFIMSRAIKSEHIVYRHHSDGSNSTVYRAASRSDAEGLLAFLSQDNANAGCFIGPPEPEGLWSAIQNADGQQKILCTYPTPNAAISFACNASLSMPLITLVVADLSRANSKRYFISKGQVTD